MGTFAETAIVDYCLSFANQGKQTSDFRFLFLFAANKWKFAVSVFHLQQRKGSCYFPFVLFSLCSISETWQH
jgi:hypothetical protein